MLQFIFSSSIPLENQKVNLNHFMLHPFNHNVLVLQLRSLHIQQIRSFALPSAGHKQQATGIENNSKFQDSSFEITKRTSQLDIGGP
jgi:hypothetical protein